MNCEKCIKQDVCKHLEFAHELKLAAEDALRKRDVNTHNKMVSLGMELSASCRNFADFRKYYKQQERKSDEI
jgi:hypothetical protein